MKILVTEAAVKLLGNLGYDPIYGARPVKRVIQQYVENEIAKGILRGEFKDEDAVMVDTEVTAFSDGQLPQQKLVFKKLEADADVKEAENRAFLQAAWMNPIGYIDILFKDVNSSDIVYNFYSSSKFSL